jgi:acetyltransferase-like isoleucine patch superfamily enzyme
MTKRFPVASFRRDESGRAIDASVVLPPDAYIGNNVTIYPNVVLREGCCVMDGAVLGRIPITNGTTTRPLDTSPRPLEIGAGTIIGCNSVLYAGNTIGSNVLISDLSSLREGCVVGNGAVIGRGVMVLYDCQIGAFARIQDQVHLVGSMIIEEYAFVGMGVMTANDSAIYLSRFGLAAPTSEGPTIRKYAVIGVGATILPGVEIGEGAMVRAGSVVTRSVPSWTLVGGAPARHIKDIPQEWCDQIRLHREAHRAHQISEIL